MLDEKSNVRDEMIDAYLRDTLPDEERAQVELWMLEDPEFHEQVRQAELMLTSFSQLENSASASIHPIKSETPHETRTSFKQWIAQPMSMAATVLLAVAATLLIRGESQLTDGVSLSNGLALNSVTTLQSTRSADNEIQLNGDTQLLQIDVGISLDDAPYQVVLTHEDGNPRFEFQLHADANGMVRLLTPAKLEGRYLLSVQQSGSSVQSEQAYLLEFNG